MRNLHPTQTEPKGLPCQCALHRKTSFHSKHKYENIFTAILLKAEKWPLKADHFCLFWECYSTHPTVSKDTFPFAKPPSANGRRVGEKPLQANLSEVSQPSWGLSGWGRAPGAPSAGHSCLIQKASSSFRQGVRTSQPAAFRKQRARRASLRVTEWGLRDLSIIRNSPTQWWWWTWPAGVYPLWSVWKRGAHETRESKSLLNSF